MRSGDRLEEQRLTRSFPKTDFAAAHERCDMRGGSLDLAGPGLRTRSKTVKSLAIISLLLAAVTCANATVCFARWPEYLGFWVVGNHKTKKCEIVTTNPIIDGTIIWFGSGPYKSLDDARLARSNIRGCPKDEPVD
jgi:hypothetical protein